MLALENSQINLSEVRVAKLLAWVNSCSDDPQDNHKVWNLNPSDAELVVSLANKNNIRAAVKNVISRYAYDMKLGKWFFTGCTIQFTTDGMLMNGQHRLKALASLKDENPHLTLPFLIVRGINKEAVQGTDVGNLRSNQVQVAQMEWCDINSGHVTSVCNVLARYHCDFNAKMSPSQIESMVLANDLMPAIQYVSTNMRTKKANLKLASVLAALVLLRREYPQIASEFIAQLRDGENIMKGSPAYYLRDWLLDPSNSGKGGFSWQEEVFLTTLTAICHRISNKNMLRPRGHSDYKKTIRKPLVLPWRDGFEEVQP